jgi:hypothetical protein
METVLDEFPDPLEFCIGVYHMEKITTERSQR